MSKPEFIKEMFDYLFLQYSKWIDVGIKDIEGNYTLIQYRYRIRDNKKQFKTRRIGFVNDSINPQLILNKIWN